MERFVNIVNSNIYFCNISFSHSLLYEIRNLQQITFIRLNRFCLLSKTPPPPPLCPHHFNRQNLIFTPEVVIQCKKVWGPRVRWILEFKILANWVKQTIVKVVRNCLIFILTRPNSQLRRSTNRPLFAFCLRFLFFTSVN